MRFFYESGAFVGHENDGADGALHALDLQYSVLENIPEFLDVRGRNQGDDIELARYLVELFEITKLGESRHNVVHLGRLHEDIYKG